MKNEGRSALALQQAGLYRAAETAAMLDLAVAERVGDMQGVVQACTRRLSIALDSDRPQPALHWGTRALPLALGSRPVSPESRARLFVHLAKAAWELGLDRDMAAYVDAARTTIEHEGVSVVTEIHYRLTAGVAAAGEGRIEHARALTLHALDLARTIGEAHMEAASRQNLCYLAVRAGAFAEAEAWIRTVLDSGLADQDLVEVLGDGVRTALAFGDLRLAGDRLRRLLNGYMEAPTRLSPLGLGYLFEVLGAYYAHRGLLDAAASLWSSAAGWFRRRGHRQDADRMERGVADLSPGHGSVQSAIDPDLLYLGRLFTAARADESQDADFQVALAVNRVLPAVAPAAEPVATEHAALLRPFQPVARLFAARSPAGRAAVRVLTGEDESARDALDVIAAYERLCATGLSWPAVIRSMKSARLASEPVRALDRLYQELVA
jgi:tetratricopeptide (TPR) repeat protein